MEIPTLNKEALAFNKSAIKAGLDSLSAISGQAKLAAESFLANSPAITDESKEAVNMYLKENQNGLESLKTHLESSLELDWTSKDTPVKSLEALESLCNEAFSQANVINKEAKALVEKTSSQLPKEAKSLVDFWSESFNTSFELFRTYVNKNFEYAKNITADSVAAAPVYGQSTSK